MKPVLPEIMLAVLLREDDGCLSARHVPLPRPKAGEVLVKMGYAPINPSDLARIKRVTEHSDRLTFIPGIEGSGRVVAHGDGLLPRLWQDKRVACNSASDKSGTWAEYMVTPASRCVPLPEEVSDEQGSMLLVNPMTAVAFFDIARRENHRAIINTAAASSLGKMVELLGKKNRIPVIHIVRNLKQKTALVNQGFENVLNSAEKNFSRDLQALAHSLDATVVFDAVGGRLTRQLMLAVPPGSSIVIYGNLSGEQPEIDHRSLVTDNKKVSGFYLASSLKDAGPVATIRNILRVRNLLKNDLKIPVRGIFPLEDAQEALDSYLGNMSAGKVLLMPNNPVLTNINP
jgi:NADPH:quinone reductase-like Zn-dependent oxidoreductase